MIKRRMNKAILVILASFIAQILLAESPREWKTKEMISFLDSRLIDYEETGAFTGAALSLVNDGEIVYSKGYGYADWERKRPVDHERTQFRIGSITKIFTTTAVLQLAGEGVLDLDRDIHDYIDFTIPVTGDNPITLHHLLTHTAGFEDRNYALWAKDVPGKMVLGEWLKDNIPAVIKPAGTVTMYSNYAMALAGYIVERTSGMSYDEYLEKNIFLPLKMMNSSARQDEFPYSDDLSLGYLKSNGEIISQDAEILQIAPAGSLSSSAYDMALFMQAHLSEGDTPLFSESIRDRMHATQFAPRGWVNGMAYGFEERDQRGLDILNHDGDTLYFHSKMVLFENRKIGLFLSVNTTSDDLVLWNLYKDFLDEFAPYELEHQSDPFFTGHSEECAGWYRSNRHSETTGEKLDSLFKPFVIRMIDEYTIQLREETFIETSPYTFRLKDNDVYLYFSRDAAGKIEYATISTSPAGVLEITPFNEHPVLHLAMAGFILLTALAAILILPVGTLIRRIKRRDRLSTLLTSARWNMGIISLMELGFISLVVMAVSDPNQILYGEVKTLSLWSLLYGIVIALFTIESVQNLMLTLRKEGKNIYRIVALVHNLSVGFFIFFVHFWHLVKL